MERSSEAAAREEDAKAGSETKAKLVEDEEN